MNIPHSSFTNAAVRRAALLLLPLCLLAVWPLWLPAQESTGGPSSEPAATVAEQQPPSDDAPDPAVVAEDPGVNLLSLLFRGGILMIPLLCMSALVVTISVERFIALRRNRVLPDQLVVRLGQLGGPKSGFDPRQAYRLCQQFPSAAANVIRAMLLKVGRPHSEVEHAVAEASEREADRLYANVRWLNLAAAVTPLLGLLGTVWGMIRAFHDTTLLAPGQNKADYLAEGIYVALVTTLTGLAVAIPAAMISHYYENRIQSLFHQIDELLFNLLPQVERFEGRVRFGQTLETGGESPNGFESEAGEPPPADSRAVQTTPR